MDVQVLTLLFTNGDGLSMNDVWKPAFVEAGIDQIAFVPPTPGTPIKQSEWPTLGQMIDSGKRVVVFMDAGADNANDNVDFIMPEFQMVRNSRPHPKIYSPSPDLGGSVLLHGRVLPLQGRPHQRPARDGGPHVHDQPQPEQEDLRQLHPRERPDRCSEDERRALYPRGRGRLLTARREPRALVRAHRLHQHWRRDQGGRRAERVLNVTSDDLLRHDGARVHDFIAAFYIITPLYPDGLYACLLNALAR